MMKTIFFIFVFVVVAVLMKCSIEMAGATSETTNGMSVTGIVQSGNGTPVNHAAIFIRTTDYLKDISGINVVIEPDAYTNEQGLFTIDSVRPGAYTIEISNEGKEALLITEIKLPGSVLDLKTVRLKTVAGIYGVVDRRNIAPSEKIAVQIYGLERIQVADSIGEFYFAGLPADTLFLRIAGNDVSLGEIDHDTVIVGPAETKDVGTYMLPFEAWRDTVVVREILDINGLTATPVSEKVILGPLGRVIELNLVKCAIKNVPGSIGTLRLRYLRLQENFLDSLPEEIGSIKTLEHLVLQKNQLITLPESIGNLINMRHLDISGNKLTVLPISIINLKQLVFLTVIHNRLHTISSPVKIWLDTYSAEKNWQELQDPL